MIVEELIAKLQQEDPKAEVHYAYPFGDYWDTEVAPKVGSVGEAYVTFSDYHRMDKLVDEPDEDDGPTRRVVVLEQHA